MKKIRIIGIILFLVILSSCGDFDTLQSGANFPKKILTEGNSAWFKFSGYYKGDEVYLVRKRFSNDDMYGVLVSGNRVVERIDTSEKMNQIISFQTAEVERVEREKNKEKIQRYERQRIEEENRKKLEEEKRKKIEIEEKEKKKIDEKREKIFKI